MKLILVKVAGQKGAIVGYAPGKKGTVKAIVASGGKLSAVPLEEIELCKESMPKEIRKAKSKAKSEARAICPNCGKAFDYGLVDCPDCKVELEQQPRKVA